MNKENKDLLKDKKTVENNELIKVNMNEIYKNGLSVKSENESNKGSMGILGTNRTLSILPQPNFPRPPFILPDDQAPSRWQCHLCKKHDMQRMIRSVNQKEWYCSNKCSDRDNDLYKCVKCGNFVGITYENNELITRISGVYCDDKDYYCSSCYEKKREGWNRNQKFSSTNTNNEEQQKEETSTSSNYSTGSYYSSSNVESECYQEDTKTHQTSPATTDLISNNSEPELVPHKAANNNPQEELEELNDFQSAINAEQQRQQQISTILAKKEAQQEKINSEKTALSNQENKKANSSSVSLIIGGTVIIGGIIFASLMFIKKSKLKAR